MPKEHQTIVHGIPPVYDRFSRVLLLGTAPSPQSRAQGFFYMHPQNRFWQVLEALLGEAVGGAPGERRAFLLRRRIALWDVLQSCEIAGASDASIRNPVPNDLSAIFAAADIRAVFATGAKAAALYRAHCAGQPGALPIRALPSTSPANARFRLDDLVEAYRAILPFLGD